MLWRMFAGSHASKLGINVLRGLQIVNGGQTTASLHRARKQDKSTLDGIMVTAMHNHLLDDEPRMVFVHFWAEGSAEAVAMGLRRALDTLSK